MIWKTQQWLQTCSIYQLNLDLAHQRITDQGQCHHAASRTPLIFENQQVPCGAHHSMQVGLKASDNEQI
jgi:hypothetical protein